MSGCGYLIIIVNNRSIYLLNALRFVAFDIQGKQVHLENGAMYRAPTATGSEPMQLNIEGATSSQIHYLRTFADARAIVSMFIRPSCCRRWREFYWPRSCSILALTWNRGGRNMPSALNP